MGMKDEYINRMGRNRKRKVGYLFIICSLNPNPITNPNPKKGSSEADIEGSNRKFH